METEEILTAIQRAAETVATPNWADKLSVIISLLAVIVAGFVAWRQYGIAKRQNEISEQQAKIMDQQNKIAIFDKQFELYDITTKCLQFAKTIFLLSEANPEKITLPRIRLTFMGVLSGKYVAQDEIEEFEYMFFYQEVCKVQRKLYQAEFLFSKEISERLIKLADSLMGMICAESFTCNGLPLAMPVSYFTGIANTLETEEILKKMKDELYKKI